MPESPVDELLTRLNGLTGGVTATSVSWAAFAATAPDHDSAKAVAAATAERERQEKLDQLLGRIAKLTGQPEANASAPNVTDVKGDYIPLEPISFQDAKLSESEVEALILKFLL